MCFISGSITLLSRSPEYGVVETLGGVRRQAPPPKQIPDKFPTNNASVLDQG